MFSNQSKLYLAKGIAIFITVFLPQLSNQEPKDPPDGIIIRYLSFTKFYIC